MECASRKRCFKFCVSKIYKNEKKNSNGTLVIGIKRGSEIEIEYSKKEIINKINSYFGYELIDEIKLETFNSTHNKKIKKNSAIKFAKNFKTQIDGIKNENIKNSLSQLLKIIQND